MSTSVTWRGREVRHPVARAVCAAIVIAAIPVVIVGVIVALPFHPLFRLFGRRGVVVNNDDGSVNFDVTLDAFKRSAR